MPTEPNDMVQYGAAALAGVAGIAFWLQKIFKNWKATSAESSVITIMHTELDRMAKQNTKLTEELNKLQLEIVSLNQELRRLTSENQNLHLEVGSLTKEVSRLHQMLAFYKMGDHNDFTS